MPDNSQIDEQNNGSEPLEPRNNLSKNQKWAAAGLAVFAFLIVILWFIQLKNNIYAPLNSNSANLTEQTQPDSQTASDLALKNKDTDGDGLSDYDELNLYHTSPYLADSDSDGIPDGVEVKNGTDPNCPTGRICSGTGVLGSGAAATSTAPSSVDVLNGLSQQSEALNNIMNQYNAAQQTTGSASQPASSAGGATSGSATPNLTPEQKQALQGIDAASLRQMLIQSGMDKATLDKISDADLMQSYSETLQ